MPAKLEYGVLIGAWLLSDVLRFVLREKRLFNPEMVGGAQVMMLDDLWLREHTFMIPSGVASAMGFCARVTALYRDSGHISCYWICRLQCAVWPVLLVMAGR